MGPKPKSNWRKRKRSPFPSESNPSMSITWTQTNLAAKLRSFGIPLSDLKPKNTSVELTPGPTKTERNFMRVAGKLSEQSISKPSGRKIRRVAEAPQGKVAQVVRRASRQE